MSQVKEAFRGFLVGIGIYAVIIEIVGIIFSENLISYTLGLVFGVLIAIFLFFHMAKTLDKALDLSEKGATRYVKGQSLLRLFIMLAVLTIGMLTKSLNFITVLLGVLGLKIGALATPFILKRMYPESYITKPEDMDVTEE